MEENIDSIKVHCYNYHSRKDIDYIVSFPSETKLSVKDVLNFAVQMYNVYQLSKINGSFSIAVSTAAMENPDTIFTCTFERGQYVANAIKTFDILPESINVWQLFVCVEIIDSELHVMNASNIINTAFGASVLKRFKYAEDRSIRNKLY